METLKKLHSSLTENLAGFDSEKAALTQLSKDVHASMISNGFATEDDRTVCTTSLSIGADGKPVSTVTCQLVYDL